jgi:hypothetical protein
MPKSTIQMSPGFAAGIFGFLFIHVAEHRVGGFVEELRLVPLVQFAQTAADGGALVVRQLGQFGKDFNRTHGKKLTLRREAGKRGFNAQFQSGKKSASGNLLTDKFGLFDSVHKLWSRDKTKLNLSIFVFKC